MRLLILLEPLFIHATPLWQRDLVGLFGDDSPAQPTLDLGPSSAVVLTAGTGISTSTATRIRPTAHTSRESTAPSNWFVATTSQALPATSFNTTLATTTSGWTTPTTSPAAPTPIVPEAPITSTEEATQWKVIGIGIIAVGLIATVILSIIFFDSWWKFLCDLICGGRRKRTKDQGQETMVLDWGTRDWEFKLANEDGHRYPTMSSLADIAEGQGRKAPRDLKLVPMPSTAVLSPKPARLVDLNSSHNSTGEPLAYRSSTR